MLPRNISLVILLFALSACSLIPIPTPQIVEQTVEVTKIIQITSTPEPTVTSTPLPPLIMEDYFDDDTYWWGMGEDQESSASVENGELIFKIDSPSYTRLVGHKEMDPISIPFDLSFSSEFIEGPSNSNLIIEFQWIDENNFIHISLSGDGFIELYIIEDGEFYTIIPWTRRHEIKRDINQFRFVDYGYRIKLYANDQLLIDMPMDIFGYGSVAIGVETWENGGAVWTIDDFVVREISK